MQVEDADKNYQRRNCSKYVARFPKWILLRESRPNICTGLEGEQGAGDANRFRGALTKSFLQQISQKKSHQRSYEIYPQSVARKTQHASNRKKLPGKGLAKERGGGSCWKGRCGVPAWRFLIKGWASQLSRKYLHNKNVAGDF